MSSTIKLIILIFISGMAMAQEEVVESTTTTKVLPPTTAQILLDNYVKPVITNTGKLVAINTLLNDTVYYKSLTGVDVDVKTGQELTNLKTNIEKEITNTEQGRNYSAGITYPVYILPRGK